MNSLKRQWNPFIIAWVLGLIFYFLEYAVRSTPSIMIPELSKLFSASVNDVSTIIGAYYITYSVTSLAAGLSFDKLGAKYPLLTGSVILGLGCILFIISDYTPAYIGRLLQGMGSAMAFPACVYLAARAFAPNKLATAIGVTQCLGMLGGSAGQFIAAPVINNVMSITAFWITLGVMSFIISLLILYFIPVENKTAEAALPTQKLLTPYKIVFSNPQSYMSGIISGLLFAPTTIFAMTWGIAFFQEDRHLDYSTATLACALVPLGWAIGCPLLGWIADKTYYRRPVIIGGGIVMILSFLQLLYLPDLVSPYASTLLLGIASGAAMIPYSIIKESNPDNVKGTATGIINFLTFGVTSLLGPVFAHFFGSTLYNVSDNEGHFRSAGLFWVGCIAIAIVTAFIIKETGKKVSRD